MSEMCCKRCGANEDRINGFCSVECEEYYSLEEEIGALDNVILERGAEIDALNARIAELEAFVNRLIEAGNTIVFETFEGYKKHGLFDFAPVNTWQVLVKDWKEQNK